MDKSVGDFYLLEVNVALSGTRRGQSSGRKQPDQHHLNLSMPVT